MKTKYIKLVNLLIIPLLILLISCGDTVEVNSSKDGIDIYPNPVYNQAWIRFYVNHPLLVTIIITDRFGRENLRPIENELCQTGANEINLNLTKLPSGLYSCIVDQGGTKTITEFTVVK